MTDVPHFSFPFRRQVVVIVDGTLATTPNIDDFLDAGTISAPPSDRSDAGFAETASTSGKIYVDEQDSAEHVTSCEARILTTPLGSRVEKPEFGIPWPMFDNLPLELGPISAALARWEPRGEADPTQYMDLIAEGTGHVRFDISIHTENQ